MFWQLLVMVPAGGRSSGCAVAGVIAVEEAGEHVDGFEQQRHLALVRLSKAQSIRSPGASDLDVDNLREWTNRMTEELRDLVAALEGCVSLEQRQADLLNRIVQGPILSTAELTEAAVVPPSRGRNAGRGSPAGVVAGAEAGNRARSESGADGPVSVDRVDV